MNVLTPDALPLQRITDRMLKLSIPQDISICKICKPRSIRKRGNESSKKKVVNTHTVTQTGLQSYHFVHNY